MSGATTLIADDIRGDADSARLFDWLARHGARWGSTFTSTRDPRRGAADDATVPRLIITFDGVRGSHVHAAACDAGFVCHLT